MWHNWDLFFFPSYDLFNQIKLQFPQASMFSLAWQLQATHTILGLHFKGVSLPPAAIVSNHFLRYPLAVDGTYLSRATAQSVTHQIPSALYHRWSSIAFLMKMSYCLILSIHLKYPIYEKVVGDVLVSWLLNTQQKPSRPGCYWNCSVQTSSHPSSSLPV